MGSGGDIESAAQQNQTSGSTSSTPPSKLSLWQSISRSLRQKPTSHWLLLLLSTTALVASLTASSLLPRLYYRGSNNYPQQSVWVISWVSTAGWPITALLLLPFYALRKAQLAQLKLLLSTAALGLLTAACNTIILWVYRRDTHVPEVSLSSLYGSSTALYSTLFGCLIARNKLVSSSLNAAFLALAAAVVVAFEFEPNRDDENNAAAYLLGLFVFDVPVSFLRGLVLALSERVLADVLGRRGSSSIHAVLVLQAVVSLFAFAFSSIGFFAGGGFGEMRDGAARATDGERSYYMVICWTAVAFQVAALTGTAVVYLSSTVLAGVLSSARVPVTSIAAVVAFHDEGVTGFKVLALVVAIWGVGSYAWARILSIR